eukprot:COSAG02_NODE_14426_length_1274_cov_1.030638_1_plen_45_part_10
MDGAGTPQAVPYAAPGREATLPAGRCARSTARASYLVSVVLAATV